MKTFILTFCLVFLAELGDKTQLATMLMAAKSNCIWLVFFGSTLALAASSLIGVLAGGMPTKHILKAIYIMPQELPYYHRYIIDQRKYLM